MIQQNLYHDTQLNKKGKGFYPSYPAPLFISTMNKEEDISIIKEEIEEIQSDFTKAKSYNNNLAGHLKKQFTLSEKSRDCIEKIVSPLTHDFIRMNPGFVYFNNPTQSKYYKFETDLPWVNFQQKYEFNPIHNHSGIFSYVLYIKIPYYSKDEENVFPDAVGRRAGKFEFVYNAPLGDLTTQLLPIDKTCENLLLFFPAKLYHCVQPFYTSDEYRISVAGNIHLRFIDE